MASARLRADIEVAALIRRVEIAGATAIMRRRGVAEAGAIHVIVDCLDGRVALYEPAPQSVAESDGRLFLRAHKDEFTDRPTIEVKLAKSLKFDNDLWIVEIEDRDGRAFVDLASVVP